MNERRTDMGANDAVEMLEAAKAECVRLERELAATEAERDAYRKAKAENDERFMLERDSAREERDALQATIAAMKVAWERQFGSNPAAFLTPGVLAEHDAKVLEEFAYIDPRDSRTVPFVSAEFGNAWAVHRGAVFGTDDLTPFQREWGEWLAEHDAKVWDEGHSAAERFQLGPKGHWQYNSERGIRTWIPNLAPVNPYRAQVIREERD